MLLGRIGSGGASRPKNSTSAWPLAEEYPVSSRALKVRILSGSLADSVKGPCTGTVGVWSESRNGWVVPPMVLTIIVDGSTFYYPDILSFILGDDVDPAKEQLDLRIELTEKKMLRTHKVAQISLPFSQFTRPAGADHMSVTSGFGSLGLSPNAVSVTGTLMKPESKKNPGNRGAIACQVELLPLTYNLEIKDFFKQLPHNINFWVIFLHTPEDNVPPAKDPSDKTPGRTNRDRFRANAVRLQAQHGAFRFGEGPLLDMEHVRKGSRAALRIQHQSDFGKPAGQIVVICGNQSLTFNSHEAYDFRLRSFLNQFRTSSTAGAWSRAVEVLGQLNPSVMVDIDLDTHDFGRLSSLGTLFITVGEQLLHGARTARIDCLQELATQAPQALCSIALHMPFDVLVRELDGVIYDWVGHDGKFKLVNEHSERIQSTSPMEASRPLVKDHSWHGDNMRVSPSSPRAQEQVGLAVMGQRKGSMMSALYRASNILGRKGKGDLDDGGIGWEGSSSLHASGTSSHLIDSGDGHDDDEAPFGGDRTWHGTKVTKEQRETGSYEYSEVPRHGALRLPPAKPYGFEGMQLVPRAGMLDALQLLSGVLGMEFLINFTMPCLRHKNSDKVQLARLIGQLHYSATTAGCSDAAKELRKIHINMLKSGDELQQINGIKSLPDFTRHDSTAVALHIEHCCRILVDILCTDPAAQNQHKMPDSTRLHLLESFVCVVPSFVRQLDEDILQNEVGVSGGAALTHQIQHPKTLQGIDNSRISLSLHDSVCRLLEAATQARQDKWLAGGGRPPETALPAIPAAPDRDEIMSSGLSGNKEVKTKRTLEERYVDAALAVVRMCHGARHKHKTPAQVKHIARSMGAWRVMIGCKFIHRALASSLAALSCQVTAEITPGHWEPAPDEAQEVLQRILEECTDKPADLSYDEKGKLCDWSWTQQIEGGAQAVKLHCQLPIILTAIAPDWKGRLFWMHAMQASYNGYLAERRVELADGTWKISEDGSHVEIPGAKKPFQCAAAIVDPLSLAYQLPAALRLFHEAGLLWAEALVLFKCMSEDDKADVRWMVSHAIHCYPQLFESDCAPVLCDTFERLLRDDDLDVAEGVHKHYMAFVSSLAKVDDDRGRLLAAMFLDQGLWERRLHFAVFQSDQLYDYIACGLVGNAREEAGDAIKLLLRHSCTTVRKNAAVTVVRLLPRDMMNSRLVLVPEDEALLGALVLMSSGTCRERQTFVWACEAAMNENSDVMTLYFKAPLEDLVKRKLKPVSRSLTHDMAHNILYRLQTGDECKSPESQVDHTTIGMTGGNTRIAANRLPQRGAQATLDPDFQVFL